MRSRRTRRTRRLPGGGFAVLAASMLSAGFLACGLNSRGGPVQMAYPVASGAAVDEGNDPRMNTENYNRITDNPFLAARDNPVSTFSVDVDTASYSNVRRFLMDGQLPPPDAVRVEELVNYFHYAYPEPRDAAPVALATEVGPCPWQPDHRLVRLGLKARSVPRESAPPRNLTFVIDVSGSMDDAQCAASAKADLQRLEAELAAPSASQRAERTGSASCTCAPALAP